jgi:holo-[acyl-carrier protein] synthase
MIVGIGLDLIEIARFEEEISRRGDGLIEEVLLPEEIAYCRSLHVPSASYAARFAAKEAFLKALGRGLGRGLVWHHIEILRSEDGAPTLRLGGEAERLAAERGVRRTHVSLTHSRTHAAAAVILES